MSDSTGPVRCPGCGRVCKNRRGLHLHLNSAHRDVPGLTRMAWLNGAAPMGEDDLSFARAALADAAATVAGRRKAAHDALADLRRAEEQERTCQGIVTELERALDA